MDVESKGRKYRLVGECYIVGLMKCEGFSMGLEQDIVVLRKQSRFFFLFAKMLPIIAMPHLTESPSIARL